MRRTSPILSTCLSTVLLLASSASAQQDSQDKSLGDVARQQREAKKQDQKNADNEKVITNDDVVSGSARAAGSSNGASSSATEKNSGVTKDAKDEAQSAAVENKERQSERRPATSVLDRTKDSAPDLIIVPSGTELKVDVDNGKTIVPVRVGFATPIPALSQVAVQIGRDYAYIPNSFEGTFATSYVDYVEYATITAVTVGDKTYDGQTNSLPLPRGGTNNELTFVLNEPVAVVR
jgi:hypothetical protein